MVRLLTGGAMFGASLAHDALCGNVPPVDSPLLGFLAMMQLSWYAFPSVLSMSIACLGWI